jgi:hypothetical protein
MSRIKRHVTLMKEALNQIVSQHLKQFKYRGTNPKQFFLLDQGGRNHDK